MDGLGPTPSEQVKQAVNKFDKWYQQEGHGLEGRAYKLVLGNRFDFDISNAKAQEFIKKVSNMMPSFIAHVEEKQIDCKVTFASIAV